jgi:hypothetical protein
MSPVSPPEPSTTIRNTRRAPRTGYTDLLRFARTVRRTLADMRPRDVIDVQSFIWVQESDEHVAGQCPTHGNARVRGTLRRSTVKAAPQWRRSALNVVSC